MAERKSRRRRSNVNDTPFTNDIELVFKYVKIDCSLNEELFDSATATEIRNIIKTAAYEIHIDKSYVAYDENKHKSLYMTPDGWNELCEMICSTNYGTDASKTEYAFMMSAYRVLILFYLYDILKCFGYDICEYEYEDILLDLKPESAYMIEYHTAKHQAWKQYPGRWQDWKDKPNE